MFFSIFGKVVGAAEKGEYLDIWPADIDGKTTNNAEKIVTDHEHR